jgi:hypothetical protein
MRNKLNEIVRNNRKAYDKAVDSFYSKIKRLKNIAKAIDEFGQKMARISDDQKKEKE